MGVRKSHTPPRESSVGPGSGFRAHVKAYFLAGVLVMAPISITLALAWAFIDVVDYWVDGLVPAHYNPETYLPFSLPGIGLLMVLAGLTLFGMLTASYLGRLVVRSGEALLTRMPVLRRVYRPLKQLLGTLLARESPPFREVVLLEYPRPGIWAIGLITGPTQGEIASSAEDELVNVFLPRAFYSYRGFFLMLPRRSLKPLSISVEDAFRMTVSCGIATPGTGSRPRERDGP